MDTNKTLRIAYDVDKIVAQSRSAWKALYNGRKYSHDIVSAVLRVGEDEGGGRVPERLP